MTPEVSGPKEALSGDHGRSASRLTSYRPTATGRAPWLRRGSSAGRPTAPPRDAPDPSAPRCACCSTTAVRTRRPCALPCAGVPAHFHLSCAHASTPPLTPAPWVEVLSGARCIAAIETTLAFLIRR